MSPTVFVDVHELGHAMSPAAAITGSGPATAVESGALRPGLGGAVVAGLGRGEPPSAPVLLSLPHATSTNETASTATTTLGTVRATRDPGSRIELVELLELLPRQRPRPGGHVGTYLVGLRGPGDDRRHRGLAREPGEREVEDGVVARYGEGGESREPLEVAIRQDPRGAVFGHRGKARARGRRLAPVVLAGQQTARQWEVGQHPEAVAHACRNDVVERLAVQHVEVVLRADEACPAFRRRRRLGRVDLLSREVRVADLAHLADTYERVERLEGLLDRHRGIGHVLLVEVDAVGAETPQAAIDRLAHPARARSRMLGVVVDGSCELGGHHHLVAVASERPAEQLLRARAAVD